MKFALVHKNEKRIHEVVTSEDDCFDIHEDFTWYKCDDNVTRDFEYVDGVFKLAEQPLTHYTVARKVGYGDIGAQLGSIYDAIMSGADDALSDWAVRQRKIKILFPKDNVYATNAANDEVRRRQDIYYEEVHSLGKPIEKQASDFTLEVAEDYISGKWINPVTGPYVP